MPQQKDIHYSLLNAKGEKIIMIENVKVAKEAVFLELTEGNSAMILRSWLAVIPFK